MSYASPKQTMIVRKSHPCWWCGVRIEKGECCTAWTWYEDDEKPFRIHVHHECSAAWRKLPYPEQDEVSFAEFSRGCLCEHGRCECGADKGPNTPEQAGW